MTLLWNTLPWMAVLETVLGISLHLVPEPENEKTCLFSSEFGCKRPPKTRLFSLVPLFAQDRTIFPYCALETPIE
jgi:hypothetical protein